MKVCVVCGHRVSDGGTCPVGIGRLAPEALHNIFDICGRPLCDFCEHAHGDGNHDKTFRKEFEGMEHGTSEWAQMREYNKLEARMDKGVNYE